MHKIFRLFWQYNLPRWSILFIDTFICAFALSLSFFIRFYFESDSMSIEDKSNLPYDFLIVLGVRFISFYISKTYKGVVRYTSSRDTMRIFAVVIGGSIFVLILNLICKAYILSYYFIPTSVIIIDTLVTLFLMITSRLAIKAMYFESKNPTREKISVIIYGAGEAGIITKRTLDRDAAIKYNVVGFVDDDKEKTGRSLEGIFIYQPDKLQELIKDNNVEIVIISIQKISPKNKNEINVSRAPGDVRVPNGATYGPR